MHGIKISDNIKNTNFYKIERLMMTKNINIPPPKEPDEDLKRVCSDLKALRESRGIALNDLFQITRISPDNLEAIENGDFHLLPPPVYTKAFIKKYAQIIGDDSKKILDHYERYLKTLKAPYEKEEVEKPPITTYYKKPFLIFSLIIMAGIVIFFISSYYKTGVNIPQHQSSKAVPFTPDVKPAEATNPQMQAKSEVAAQASAEASYHLSIEAKELTWLRIGEGQNSPYEVLLQPGKKIERRAPSFVIDIGNAGGVNVKFQGSPLSSLGKPGQVVHLKLP
ncbi:MAG: hypothetical protein AUK24_07980 [Syntrophaceae bacterium CG2_30_49_12]|nr:MAG: hypothetical protein AUK24_07980 [Syntrophaceae bacterium CG2_30_49_12]PIP06908.1 MAG: hypothetical protein COX52_05640 [Syntrophobacterales bacterium CG23_combo_of_CG06-09_8_20_14_all_48_27]PJA47597.1 MAG: hypothetical protein CO171_09355 [Syntrophobacterales bacterium CG_4_9_14_3_um_filter_49_8]PJC76455.1 MAG: hypothetical protein CO012_01215 [Syntrophobacterales bacterium CG_4_8_14_3_um_filter_49_14]